MIILLSASGMSANEIAGLRRIPRQPPAGTGQLDLIGVVLSGAGLSHHRAHTALGGRPPSSRVPNLTGQNT